MQTFQSPFLRALLRKGHAYKLEMNEETLLQEVAKGLDGYINYKSKHTGDPTPYLRWRQAVLTRIKVELKKGDVTMYPNSRAGTRDIEGLHRDIVFLKEDRAPHVAVGMCKYRYMRERQRYLTQGGTFQVTQEPEEDIIKRHAEYHRVKGLAVNKRLPYVYGIWKSAKRGLRWISGARKGQEEEQEDQSQRPKASIAGAGTELVGLLQQVMRTLVSKDEEGRRRGQPKRCWFVESVEEVAQAIRFDATKVAEFGATADTVDFVTMYPKFNQQLLIDRVSEAVREAWDWEEAKHTEMGEQALYLSQAGWVEAEGVPSPGQWTREEVTEMVTFVVNNGYIKRGHTIHKQVEGFGMGLACAPQLANLGCYVVERDFAGGQKPEDVEHNYRFIDDILTLTGCIPSEEAYGMKYKSTRQKTGHLIYLGMEMDWEDTKRGKAFTTGMHFRDASYPIQIRRYPANGSMVTDSQRIGVVTGQFIRAQRICSVLRRFKQAVQDVALAALRRGYKKNELDRVWGRFLAQWWKAQEVRRGELRAWFRRMLRVIQWKVWQEPAEWGSSKTCKFQAKCRYKDFHCPFVHPAPSMGGETADTMGDPPTREEAECALARARMGQPDQRMEMEQIPKTEATIQAALGDGSCLFHCLVGENNVAKAQELRAHVAKFVEQHVDSRLGECPMTVREALLQRGLTPEAYRQGIMMPSTHGGELELFLIAQMQQRQVKVFMDKGEHWGEVAHFGTMGELTRLLYSPQTMRSGPHYDTLQLKERWVVQRAQLAAEEQRRKQNKEGERAPVKSTESERKERADNRAKQYIERTKEGRKTRTQESREKPTREQLQQEADELPEDQETLNLLVEVAGGGEATYCVCQRPYSIREYYIQCAKCQGWYHPKCLGKTRAECEAQRQAGWECGRAECAVPGNMESRQKEKEE